MKTAKKEKFAKRYLLLNPDGTETETNIGEIKIDKSLSKLISINLDGHANYGFANHMNVMQKLELVDYENASDKGHYRYYPKGALIFDLIRMWLKHVTNEYFEAFEIRTPFIYDWNRLDIQGQAGLFSEQIYRVKNTHPEQEFALRYGGDVGVFSIVKDAKITYRHLPLRLFEDCQGFRLTKTGEISGIRRGRTFSFPDVHSFCADFNSSLNEYKIIYELQHKLAKDLDLRTATIFKVTEELYPKVKNVITSMSSVQKQISLIELMNQQRQYWAMKHISYTEHPQKLFHVQLDLEDGERYGMHYVDIQNKIKPLIVVHSSIGSIEKWIVLAIEEALKKNPPILPLWLAPIQLRLMPVNTSHLNICLEIARNINKSIRVDIDDREISLAKRIKFSEQEWVPNIVVIGNKEKENGIFQLRARGEPMRTLALENIVKLIHEKTAKMPFKQLPGIKISERLRFR